MTVVCTRCDHTFFSDIFPVPREGYKETFLHY